MSTILINLVEVSYSYITRPVLQGLNWEIQAGQKIGLVGANGSGKSTLLKLILARLAPETGTVFRAKDLTIGYLPQDPELDLGESVLEAGLSGSPEIVRLRRELAERGQSLRTPSLCLRQFELAIGFRQRFREQLVTLGLAAIVRDEAIDRDGRQKEEQITYG